MHGALLLFAKKCDKTKHEQPVGFPHLGLLSNNVFGMRSSLSPTRSQLHPPWAWTKNLEKGTLMHTKIPWSFKINFFLSTDLAVQRVRPVHLSPIDHGPISIFDMLQPPLFPPFSMWCHHLDFFSSEPTFTQNWSDYGYLLPTYGSPPPGTCLWRGNFSKHWLHCFAWSPSSPNFCSFPSPSLPAKMGKKTPNPSDRWPIFELPKGFENRKITSGSY